MCCREFIAYNIRHVEEKFKWRFIAYSGNDHWVLKHKCVAMSGLDGDLGEGDYSPVFVHVRMWE